MCFCVCVCEQQGFLNQSGSPAAGRDLIVLQFICTRSVWTCRPDGPVQSQEDVCVQNMFIKSFVVYSTRWCVKILNQL